MAVFQNCIRIKPMVFWETESFTLWRHTYQRRIVWQASLKRTGIRDRKLDIFLIFSYYDYSNNRSLSKGGSDSSSSINSSNALISVSTIQPGCRNTCLCQLHIKGSQSQRGAPRLLWEEEGGHEAIIVSGPEEQEDRLKRYGWCCSSKAPLCSLFLKLCSFLA